MIDPESCIVIVEGERKTTLQDLMPLCACLAAELATLRSFESAGILPSSLTPQSRLPDNPIISLRTAIVNNKVC